MTQGTRKIAIIGGGIASIAAAYALTQQVGWQQRYDITIYQRGWRLGGKCASGRNRKKADRIEEHGLHIWAGFYDNAFSLIRSCYDELVALKLRSPDAPLGTLDKALKPLNSFMLTENVPGTSPQEWRPWFIEFPPNDKVPGTGGVLPQPFDYFKRVAEFLACQVDSIEDKLPQQNPSSGATAIRTPIHHLVAYSRTMPSDARLHTAKDNDELMEILEGVRIWLDGIKPGEWINDDVARRVYFMLDLGTAFATGMVVDLVFLRGFNSIDNIECTAWLLKHGASLQAVNSAAFRGCYDYVFGYPAGIRDHRGVGAGTAMRGLLRLAFTYKEALFFKMQAGMGDTIFAPYYQVLKQKGVRFKFFHAVTNLALSVSRDAVERIDLVEQARVLSGSYDPLFDVKGLPCWPSEPDWSQLVDGEKLCESGIDFESEKIPEPVGLPKSLRRGVDFDDVILGASLASLPFMTKELTHASPRWKQMLQKVETVATCAVQFWLNKPTSETGWPALVRSYNQYSKFNPTNMQTVMTGFAEPLDTWADMSHLLVREAWPDPAPQSIAYFCSPSRNADVPLPSMQEQAAKWADEHLVRIWPEARNTDGGFDRNLLVSLEGQSEGARFANQYFRQNFYGSERYVLSVPGSLDYRLAPDESGFVNLVITGDWTLCGINAGCVEAATISGLAAARVFTGSTEPIYGELDLVPSELSTPALLSSTGAPYADWPLTSAFLRGSMEGVFSFHAFAVDQVTQMLAPGLVLSKQSLTPPKTHPVTFLFNQQTNVRASFLPQIMGFKSYLENIVAINCVEIEGGDGTVFSFLPALFLDNALATYSGRLFYGLAKQLANNTLNGSVYRTVSEEDLPIWQMRYFDHAPIGRLVQLGNISLVRALLDAPILTPRFFGTWQAMAFDFSVGSAFAAPVAAHLDIYSTNGIGLPAGRLISPPFRGGQGENGLPGAFRCWTDWTLSNPFDSSRVKTVAAAQRSFDFNWKQ
ncbi:NAD(P)-binding protein [Rhizobium sp. P40RR-XXII]|uniref:NAD(P)-binding protein n=1 Tax=unclassified Rhizobium TaxID=2613769 RepID=UPI00145719AB|nr:MULTISPECIES: NAD(P)-binding protein [unclassified Rhizobium]NLR89161.1 NAD(P)-binding protein [Rhizobium sp. P28RR-XV]NLS21021.1 NAD(P)-binding protein [Rhizobium sp. P40RR-XXII]